MPSGQQDKSTWLSIWVLFFAGCTLALHIGKVPPAIGLLSNEFSLSLTQSGAIVSMYAILIAASGLFFGAVAPRLGYVPLAVLGILFSGLGSLIGANTSSYFMLLASRVVEGSGWIMAAITMPSILTAIGRTADRSLILGIWGAFVPIGAGTMLFAAPLIQSLGGWRASWLLAGGTSLCAAVLVLCLCIRHTQRLSMLSLRPEKIEWQDIRKPAAWCVGACFFCYSAMYIASTAFLPSLLMARHEVSLELAARLTALVVLCNAVGNIGGGWLLRKGARRYLLLCLAFVLSGVALSLVYAHPGLALELRFAAALFYSISSGVIPGTLFATAPLLASSPVAAALLIGLMLQCSGAGQWVGPIALPAIVEATGLWSASSWMYLLITGSGVFFAFRLRALPN